MNTGEKTKSTQSGGARILVVDDHPNTATTLARAITQLGPDLEVLSATSGAAALEQLQGAAVDLLITDMMMPDMNGLEVIEALKANPAGRPTYTILITAYDIPGLRISARRLKVNQVLIKPFRPERLCQIVSAALDEIKGAKIPKGIGGRKSFKLLIADDAEDNVALLSRFLENEGYSLIAAANGEAALERIRADMPDLVLLDVNMPEKDGFEVLQEVRADPAIQHVPVIILTAARPDPLDIQSGLNLGADDYMTKPFDRRELLARIRTKLRAKETEEAIRRRNNELNVLPEIGKQLAGCLEPGALTDVILRTAVETLGAAAGHIVILDAQPLHKEWQAAGSSTRLAQLPPLNVLLAQFDASPQGWIVPDTGSDPLWQSPPDGPAGSALTAPLWGRSGLTGLLALVHEQAGFFQANHLLLLQAIASQAAIAVGNAQLHASLAAKKQASDGAPQDPASAVLAFDAQAQLVSLNSHARGLFQDCAVTEGAPLPSGCGYEELEALLKRALASAKPESGEITWPDHRVFSALAAPSEGGGCTVSLHDVSRFRTLEREKNNLIAAASHDLKGSITIITILSELLVKAGGLNERQMGYTERMLLTAQGMNELVQNLLGLADMDMVMQHRQESVDLSALVLEAAEAFRPQAEAQRQALALRQGGGRPRVQGDPLLLRLAFRNLVSNAVKYTPAEGSIHVSVTTREGEATVTVKDTGCGIPPSDLPFIFERFYRARHEAARGPCSNGLGLAIVKSIVERHQGRVSATSEPGKGSCFTVNLPLFQPEALVAPAIPNRRKETLP